MRKAEVDSPGFPSAKSMRIFFSFMSAAPFRAGSQRQQIGRRNNVDRFEGGFSPPAVTHHRKPAQLTRLKRAVLWIINCGRGFVHSAAGAAGVKLSSREVTETLRALRTSLQVPQKKCS